jgi:hemerythrin-like metal-binding protein
MSILFPPPPRDTGGEEMAKIANLPVWTDDCSVSVQEIDAQHRALFGLVANLARAVGEGKGGRILLQTFDRLADYSVEHFQTEERYMQQFSYPELGAHRAEHERFARKVGYFRRGLAIGKSCVADEVLDFLTHWLVHHIQDVDRRYVDCFRAHGLS